MPRIKHSAETKLCETALRLAGKQGWPALTLEHIAKATKIPPAQARKIFPDRNRILPAIVKYIDDRMVAGAGKPTARTGARDRLFEIFMARFDVLQNHRAGILAILREARREPAIAQFILPAQWQAMKTVASLAHLKPASGFCQPAVIFGLLGVYYRTLWHWQKDSTPDMTKTMSVLDQNLRLAGRISEILLREKRI